MKTAIQCLIVDDEPLARGLIEKHLAQIPGMEIAGSCWNAVEAFELLKQKAIDLIFLDIQMPMLTGIEFVKSLPQPPAIIFTTAYRDFAVESYELNVIDYLVKPITFQRLFQAVNKFTERQQAQHTSSPSPSPTPQEENFMFVNVSRKFVKVRFAEICYIESLKDYIRIHTLSERIVTKDKISSFLEKLPEHFVRIHRSYLINLHRVDAFTQHEVDINGQEIPIGQSYKQQALLRLQKR